MITTINEWKKQNENVMTKLVPEVGKFYKAFDMSKNGALTYSSIELKDIKDGVYHFVATNKTDNVIDVPVENNLTFIEIKNPITAKIN